MQQRLTLRKTEISYYILNFLKLLAVILLSLKITTTFLFSKENLQSTKEISIVNNNIKFKKVIPISQLFFSSNEIFYVFVSAQGLNLRSGPGLNYSVLRLLPRGTHLLSLSSNNSEWLRVYDPQNFEGWVYRKHVIFYNPKSLGKLNKNNSSKQFRSILEVGILNYVKEIYELKKLNISDKLSIIVEDMGNREIVTLINPEKILKSGSTIKVPILHAYMLKRSERKLIENSNHKDLIEKMIRFSSNSSTNNVIELLGGLDNTQKILKQTKSYKHIKLVEYIPENGRAYRNAISVSDLNYIFSELWFQRIIGNKYSEKQNRLVSIEMLNLLNLPGHTWLKDRIKAGTCYSENKTVKLWDKTGFVKGSNGNAGIVEISTPFGRKAYSIVLFIERKDFHSITGNAKRWFENSSMHMRRISEMTFAYFSNRYKSYNKCGLHLLIQHTKNAF